MAQLRIYRVFLGTAILVLCFTQLVKAQLINAYPKINWPGIHADARNSDTIDAEGAHWLQLVFRFRSRLIAAVPTVGPTGLVYVTTSGMNRWNCSVWALDSVSGQIAWCASQVGPTAVSSSVLSDVDGNVYIGDDAYMWSFTSRGEYRWKSRIAAAPLSAQFQGDGSLLFISHNGVVYVLSRRQGRRLVEPLELIPGLEAGNVTDCLVGSSEGSCASANTPAVDLVTGRIFLTLTRPGAQNTSLVALQYLPRRRRVIMLWEADVLGSGSGASPALNAARDRVYVTDANDNLLAVDAANGAVIWQHPIGFSPLGSPAVKGGLIIPGPVGTLIAIRDNGDTPSVAWRQPDIGVVGTVAIAGSSGYSAGNGKLIVFDVETGEVRQTLSGPLVSIGTSVASDGRVFTASFTALYGYEPRVEA